jgi:deazaflavin-dependent oxidoreductase (nitroreductase family)
MARYSLPDERPQGLDSPMTARLIKYGAKAQVRLFKLTNGRIGSKWRIGAGQDKPVPTLLMEHIGRKSGTKFTTPLLYMENGTDLIVVASQGGLPKNPQWLPNLEASPETLVHVKGQRSVPVRARVANEAERAELWPRLVELYADFERYARWTDRVIPVVILERR